MSYLTYWKWAIVLQWSTFLYYTYWMLVLPAKYEDMFCETTEYVASFSTLKLIHIQSVKKIKIKTKKKNCC